MKTSEFIFLVFQLPNICILSLFVFSTGTVYFSEQWYILLWSWGPHLIRTKLPSVGPSSNFLDAEPIRSNLFHVYLMTVCLKLLAVGFYWFSCASIDLSLLYWWSNFMGQLWHLIWCAESFLSQPLHNLLSNWRGWLLDWIHLGSSSRRLSCLCDRGTWWLLWWWLPPCHLTLTLPPWCLRGLILPPAIG